MWSTRERTASSRTSSTRADTDPDTAQAAPALGAPLRQILPWGIGLVLLAALAWVVTIRQANGMGVGPGTMGLTLVAFIALWVVMMAAMMFPSVAPMVAVWIRPVSTRPTARQRLGGVTMFLGGYLIAWAAFGVVAYGALVMTGRLA